MMSENTAKREYVTQEEVAAMRDELTPERPLETVNSVEIAEYRFKRKPYLVEGLLKPGLVVLAGSPKVGKSWLVLQLCMQIAKGEPFWDMQTKFSEVLYLALEDSEERLQRRVLTITGEPSPALHFALNCSSMEHGLEKELLHFITEHPLTRLIVIDTFQMVRNSAGQPSYGGDYADASRLKKLADAMNICVMLIHHTRKLADSDPLNEISGTNGIAGCADTLMILKKEKRTDRKATFTVTGRDVEDMELELNMDQRSCRWKCVSELRSITAPPAMPDILCRLADYIKEIGRYEGPNAVFCEQFSAYLGEAVNMTQLNRKLGYFRYELEDRGVYFMLTRTAKSRGLIITYKER
jgi:hypothetical protein